MAEIATPNQDGANRGSGIKILIAIMIPLSVVTVALRFWSRALIAGKKLWWDDWLCLISLPFFLVIAGASIAWVDKGGLGRHVATVPLPQIRYGLRLFYYSFIPYQISITLPKLSCVMFYARVFAPHNSRILRWNIWTLSILIVVNTIACILVNIFQCHPVDQYWKQSIPNACINIPLWQILHAGTNLLFDFYILVLPIPILAKLHTSKRRRLLIITIFTLGYGVALVTLAALIAIAITGASFLQDYTWYSVPPLYFELLEPSAAIICICLPSVSSLIRRGQQQGLRALFRRPPSTHAAKPPRSDQNHGFMRLGGRSESGDNVALANLGMHGPGRNGTQAIGSSYPGIDDDVPFTEQEIHVRRDFEVTVEKLWSTM